MCVCDYFGKMLIVRQSQAGNLILNIMHLVSI